ncbi:MAG: GNAT family N-acetyltransferase [Cyclobacteriaceae bacterium]
MMEVLIEKYKEADYEQLMQLIRSEGEEWESYLNPRYKLNLEQSITYVARVQKELCGYSRAMLDQGYFIWVIDLLVDRNYRGNGIGKKLLDCIKHDHPDLEIYVMSDVDPYYEKMGYQKEGSIFKIE